MTIEEYRNSWRWKQIRSAVIMRDNFRCRLCNSEGGGKSLEVHHRIYEETLGQENLNDLLTLCHDCHDAHEKRLSRRREATEEDKMQKLAEKLYGRNGK